MCWIKYEDLSPVNLDMISTIETYKTRIIFRMPREISIRWHFDTIGEMEFVYNYINNILPGLKCIPRCTL
jgi:hypothetical protein